MAESIRITYRVLSTRHWNAEHSLTEANRYKDLLERLRPFIEPLPLQCVVDRGSASALFGLFDEAFDVENPFAWNVVSFSISLLELLVTKLTVIDLPVDKILGYVSTLLEHNEPRIRIQTSELVKAASYQLFDQLCLHVAYCPSEQFHHVLGTALICNIASNWGRSNTTREALLGDVERIQMDDTTGWNHLESYLKASHALVIGISCHSVAAAVSFLHSISVHSVLNNTTLSDEQQQLTEDSSNVDGAVLLISLASRHINRHIRETTFKFIAQLLSPTTNNAAFPGAAATGGISKPVAATVIVDDWYTVDGGVTADRIHQALLAGLQDDWSQIRHGAALACQSFLVSLTALSNTHDATTTTTNTASDNTVLSKYWAGLLPRVCMNRFYPAAAVQTVSQATWREVLGPQGLGRTLLAHHAAAVATYYCDMTHARNHMTAEAACQAMAEFCVRIDATAVRPQVPLILQTLCLCLEDDRWPVRDAAIVASGIVVRYFPLEQTTQSSLTMLMGAWVLNLKDFIWSIREHAAMAFAEALQCNTATTEDPAVQAQVAQLRSTVLTTALKYVSANLHHALHPDSGAPDSSIHVVPDSGLSQAPSTAAPASKGKAVRNFLPESLLQADAAIKKRLSQPLTAGEENAASGTALPATSASTVVVSKSKDRKGWGCCIDCIELRTCQPWEVSHGALYLLREVSAVQPALLFHQCGDSVASALAGESADFTLAVQDPKETYFGKMVYLLDTTQASINHAVGVSSDVSGVGGGVSQSKTSSSNTEAEQLVMAILEEVPALVSTALAHLLPKDVRNDRRESIVLRIFEHMLMRTLLNSISRILKAGESAASTDTTIGAMDTTAASSAAVSGSAGAMNRRNLQAARRSARNKDKVVLAAEKCLHAVDRAFQDASAGHALYGGYPSVGKISPLFSELLALCDVDVRDSIANFLST